MYMVGHAVNSNHFMIIVLENACYILVQSFFPFIMNKRRTVFDSKNKLYMQLCISVSHEVIKK